MQNEIAECINKIKNKTDIRKQLIILRNLLKNNHDYDKNDFYFLENLLNDEDPKVRKNAALIIGELGIDTAFNTLFYVYLNEEQLFIRESLLKAISYFDLTDKVNILEKRSILLNDLIHTDESKHYLKEQRVLKTILKEYKQSRKHTFIGLNKEYNMVLTTLKNHQDIVSDSLIELQTKKSSLGVLVKTKSLRYIMQNHCFKDIIFPLFKVDTWNIQALSEKIASPSLFKFLYAVHQGEKQYRFRLVTTTLNNVEIRKLCDLIEVKSHSLLTNDSSDYEIEIQIKKNKSKEALIYLKLMCIEDLRFNYREQFLPTSINPVVAGTIIQYCIPYIKENADVLDPFCGVGTMLIERNYIESTHFMMGVDYYGDAINKAKRNTSLKGDQIHYVQRDIVSFTHRHQFDEIITNMPISNNNKVTEIQETYHLFFKQMNTLLVDDGYAFLHTSEIGLIKKCIKKNEDYFELIDEVTILIGSNRGSCLFILRKKG